MKKISFLLLLGICTLPASAESMKFVTSLSQPVGLFSSVDVVSATNPDSVYHLNFCSSKVSSGEISVKSLYGLQLKLSNNAVLTSTTYPLAKVKATNLILKGRSDNAINWVGKNLEASSTVTLNRRLNLSTEDPYGNPSLTLIFKSDTATAYFETANFAQMVLADNTQYTDTSNDGNTGTFSWSTLGQDYCNSKGHSNCSNIILYADKGDLCDNDTFRAAHRSDCCPSRPYSDTVCWKISLVGDNYGTYSIGDCNMANDNCGYCTQQWPCSASNVGERCNETCIDDGGLEEWENTCAHNYYGYTCTATLRND